MTTSTNTLPFFFQHTYTSITVTVANEAANRITSTIGTAVAATLVSGDGGAPGLEVAGIAVVVVVVKCV